MSEMFVKAIAPWFGGKRTMAPDIVRELGPHTQYFEPFCGSMAVLFAKQATQKETVNDLHGDLINLARVLQSELMAIELYERCERTVMSEGLLKLAQSYFCDAGELEAESAPDPERAYWYFLASWLGRNGTAGTARMDYQIAVRWTKNGGSPTVRWSNASRSIPAWHARLRNVCILNRCGLSILDRFEDVSETAIYVDPPYVIDGEMRSSTGRYLFDFTDQADHEQLRDYLKAYERARVVVSYYDCPLIRELYDGWTFVAKTRQKHLHAQNGRGARSKRAPEVLILNGESFA